MSWHLIVLGLYILGGGFFTGVHVSDELRFKNPEYAKAVLAAWVWPVLLPWVAYRRWRD